MEGERKRYVLTSFWNDSWVQTLPMEQKLFYLYLLTNPLTNVAGVYEITERRISFDTGIEENDVKAYIKVFRDAGKIEYVDGYVILLNFLKYQNVGNAKIYTSICKTIDSLPEMAHRCLMDDSCINRNLNLNNKFKKEIRNKMSQNSEEISESVDNPVENSHTVTKKSNYKKMPQLCKKCGAVIESIDKFSGRCRECGCITSWNTLTHSWLWGDVSA